MDEAAARVDGETLDAIQVAVGRVSLGEFRLLPGCGMCQGFLDVPATPHNNTVLRQHILSDHADKIVSSVG